jgi:coenzyme F420 biosynthesis associated uncharacterized protein
VRRRLGRAAIAGIVLGLATAAVAEAVRPRGGTAVLVDWDRVRLIAEPRLGPPSDAHALAGATRSYRAMAAKLEAPLIDFVGRDPSGLTLPQFRALDREGWLDVNLVIIRRVIDPILEQGRLPNSLLVDVGRAGLDHYIGLLLAFLGHHVLGQYDPQLLGTETLDSSGLYLVEPNVDAWEKAADLPAADLRRWLILHEMTHAWQFAAHPWLRTHIESTMKSLIQSTTAQVAPAARLAAFAGVLPAQWKAVRQMQGTMSLIEGYSNLVMNRLGRELLPEFDRLEAAYHARTKERGLVETLLLKLTGLDLKLQQYKQGEAFCSAVYERHGMKVLNRAWERPENMPRLEELDRPEDWVSRIAQNGPLEPA